MELFAARAAAAAPGFALDEESAPWVAAICARLDGLPLALELAAARVRALGARGVAERLDDRFQLLSAEIRGLPPRQRTLRAVIDWSWEQLTGAQRAGMFALAVQPGGCTLEAAEAVGAGLDVLDQLVNRSMVVVDTPPRYRLLESVAAYCLDRLDPADPVFVRRDAYYTELAERAAPHLYGHAQGHWLRRLDEESPNLRAVLDSGADPSRPACALAWYWYLRGKHSEGHRYLAGSAAWGAGFAMLTGVGGATPVQPPDARSRWFLAHAHLHLGDAAAAEELIEAALADFRASGDRWGEAAALAGRAKKAIFQGELKAAERDGEESLALFGELGDRWGRLQALDQLGYLAELGGVPPPGSSAIRAPSPWPPRGWPERLPPPRRRAACWRRRARSGSRSALPSRPPSAGTWRGSPPGSRARRGTTQGCFRVVPDGTPPRFVGELAIVKTKQTMVMAGLIGLGVTLTGCGLVGATDRETAAYDVTDKVTGLRVEADSGTVEVVESDRTGIHVTETLIWEKSKPTTSHVVKGDTLMLTFTCPISVGFNSGCDVSYLVEVPKGLRVDVESDSGQVTLTNLSGEVKVTSDSGGIEADRLTAKRVRTETDSGGTKLVFTTPPDRVETKSDSGATEVRVPKGPYHVTAETQSGGKEIDAVHDDSAPRTIEMSSDSGRLEIVAS
ncbi:hypothetical protein GCM10010404_53290 [Nonomuraea africana]|uniref:Tetratricopeptide (TPR) repeat protein n=1 Tax=Nonomuraea africana TaxID=46171 RepID=A0ABR9K5H4_9ACTN|nr:DUF4097 family beta strand repeat-containing protein [Nonomuraea africana]MBE1557255.1 tetratricopeptide (TPR) repeat protein [Nonomuraea africana]